MSIKFDGAEFDTVDEFIDYKSKTEAAPAKEHELQSKKQSLSGISKADSSNKTKYSRFPAALILAVRHALRTNNLSSKTLTEIADQFNVQRNTLYNVVYRLRKGHYKKLRFRHYSKTLNIANIKKHTGIRRRRWTETENNALAQYIAERNLTRDTVSKSAVSDFAKQHDRTKGAIVTRVLAVITKSQENCIWPFW